MHKKLKILLMLFSLFLITGCTQYKTIDKKAITDSNTGQRVIENLLCKTTETEERYNNLKQKYTEDLNNNLNDEKINQDEYNTKLNEINDKFNIDNVIYCNNFSINSGTDDGLWTNLFVKSLAWLLIKVGLFTKNYGWAIIIITILIRLLLYPITKKSAMQSENMQKAKGKLSKLEEKYRNRNDKDSQMMKAQEMMNIYKEYNISPMSGCIFALINIPLFFAFYEALYRLPIILEENFYGINLGITPLTALSMGKYYYVVFIFLVIFSTYYSFKLNSAINNNTEQAKQMKMMTNFSIIMISIASFTISTGIALYWITNSSFTIIQNLLVKRSDKNASIS